MIENIRLAFQGIASHKLRSMLTMIGIIIGIAAIIAIVSTIKGANEEIKNSLIGSGNNKVEVTLKSGGLSLAEMDSSMKTGIPQIPKSTLEEIAALDEVISVSSYVSKSVFEGIYYKTTALTSVKVFGVDESYFSTCNYTVREGRRFIQSDYDIFRTVLIVDKTAAKTLFPDEDPLGKTVEITGTPFTVVGVVEERNQYEAEINSIDDVDIYSEDTNGALYMPKASWPIVYSYDEPEDVVVRAASTDDMTQAGKKTARILNDLIGAGKRTSMPSAEEEGMQETKVEYTATDLAERARSLQNVNSRNNLLMLVVAGISLIVGSIGVMNIMLVSVTERTAEIGLKKAIGAPKSQILWQFLTEAAVLTSIGGIVGVGAGIGAAYIINYFSETSVPVAIDVGISLGAVLFSTAIGLIAGSLPSVKAANLDPIEALRRE